ncbi:hypothetical protein FRB99_001407, partial [Tulasnella sp. 403]
MRQNKEKGIEMADRVTTLLQVLTEKMAVDMEQALSLKDDIARLESTLEQIAEGLERLTKRRRRFRPFFLAQANRDSLSAFDASLSEAISLFGVASQLTIGKSVAKLLPPGESDDERVIRVDSLTTSMTLYRTENYWIYTGTYDEGPRKTNVLIKKYLRGREKEFLEDLETHIELIHPNIAALWAVNRQTRMILLTACDFVYGTPIENMERTRRPWDLQSRLNLQSRSLPSSESELVPLLYPSREYPYSHDRLASTVYVEVRPEPQEPPRETVTVKHSAIIKRQLEDVAEFLAGMQIDVAWWQFGPQWVAFRSNHQFVLLDWATRSSGESSRPAEADPDPG